MAQVAVPLDERVVALDHLEDVCAVVGECHDAGFLLVLLVLASSFPVWVLVLPRGRLLTK